MNKRLLALAIGMLWGGIASAQTTLTEGATTTSAASDRNQAIEFKFGGYRPLIDSGTGVANNPFKTIVGSGAMLLAQLELDRYLWQGFGAAGAFFSVGYAEKYGHALVLDPSGTPAPSAETAGFFVAPMRLGGVYRFDWAAQKYSIPLVPYVKAGLIYEAWWSTKSGNIDTISGGGRALGGKWGYGGTAGLALLLDIFEPRLARDFDTDLGVNHSYFFAEYDYSIVNNFGGRGLDLSSKTWMFGLTLEF